MAVKPGQVAVRLARLMVASGLGLLAWSVHVGPGRDLWVVQPVLIWTGVLFATAVVWDNALSLANASALGLAAVGVLWSLHPWVGAGAPHPGEVVVVLVLAAIGFIASSSRVGPGQRDFIAGGVTVVALAAWAVPLGRGWWEVLTWAGVLGLGLVRGVRSTGRERAS